MNISLAQIFDNIDLSWIDSSKGIINSQLYFDLLSIFPNLEPIFQEGIKNDKDEFIRTIRHTFRVFKVFFLIKNGDFTHDSLSQNSLAILRDKI